MNLQNYIAFRTIVADIFGSVIKLIAYGIAMVIITNPEALANWIKVVRSGFGE
jgi:hypothetical protein